MKHSSIFWSRRALLLSIPLILAGGVWKVRQFQQLRQPIFVSYGPEDIQSRVLFERIAKEAREHPYARNISVGWSKPWPKQSGLNLFESGSLSLNRDVGVLEYGIMESGWAYYHVEQSGIELLAHAHLPRYPTSLSPLLDAQLRKKGGLLNLAPAIV